MLTSSVSDLDEKTVIEHMLGYKEIKREFVPNSNIGPEILEVDHLSTDSLVDDVSFNLKQGEIVGLAGLLGSGRTEIVRAIYGADKKTKGTIRINGKPVTINSPSEAVRAGMGLLHRRTLPGDHPTVFGKT